MSTLSAVFIVMLIAAIDMMPAIKKKQSKEAAVLIVLGAITLVYGYYYNTHIHTASLVNTILELLNIR